MVTTPSLSAAIQNSLAMRGSDPSSAQQFGTFVGVSIGILLAARKRLVELSTWDKFLRKRGTWTKTKGGPRRLHEDALSLELVAEARSVIHERECERIRRRSNAVGIYSHMLGVGHVQPDEKISSDSVTGPEANRLDIVFYPNAPELEIHFSAEAKVVETAGEIKSELFGDSGLHCYMRAVEPYPCDGAVLLIAYVEDSKYESMMTSIEATAGENEYLHTSSRGKFTVGSIEELCEFDAIYADSPHEKVNVCLATAFPFPLIREEKPICRSKKGAKSLVSPPVLE